jgi:hypothetical protein
MIKLHVPLWEVMARGAALYMVAAFMLRGHKLKRRLRGELISNKRSVPAPSRPEADLFTGQAPAEAP